MQQNKSMPAGLLRLPDVLNRFPVSKSRWYAGIKSGEFPAGVKFGVRCTFWRSDEIDALVKKIGGAK